MIDYKDIEARAAGRWPSILSSLGIPEAVLRNKHQPCPFCGGKDRFRFSNKDNKGCFICSQCGAGNGLQFLMKFNSWDFPTALKKVADIVGSAEPKPPDQEKKKNRAKRAQRIKDIFGRAEFHGRIKEYLLYRGISIRSKELLYVPNEPYYDDGKKMGVYSAMIAPVRTNAGKVQSVHRTYFGIPKGHPKRKMMPPVDSINGCSIQLFPHNGILGVAEGIETALAASELFNIPAWACINANNMEQFNPPESVRELIIYGDNDESYTGQKSAYVLANRLTATKQYAHLKIEVSVPFEVGDWLDVLNRKRA